MYRSCLLTLVHRIYHGYSDVKLHDDQCTETSSRGKNRSTGPEMKQEKCSMASAVRAQVFDGVLKCPPPRRNDSGIFPFDV